jgi:hypothetical protein
MPVHFANERERADYIIAHAELFITRYKTMRNGITEEWPDIETARKAAKFAVIVSGRVGRIPTGITIHAVMGDYDAFVETHYAPPKHHASPKLSSKLGS